MNTTIYWPAELPAPLTAPKTSFVSRAIETEMESARRRVRRTEAGSQEFIEVSWNFTQDQYEVFRAFFNDTLRQGSNYFLLPLKGYQRWVDRAVSFVDAKYTFSHTDNLYNVSATLELYQSEVFDRVEIHEFFEGDHDMAPVTLAGRTSLTGELSVLFNAIPFKNFDGMVYAIVPTTNGVYVSGRFTSYGSDLDTAGYLPCKGICRILRNGELDQTFKPGDVLGGGFDITYPHFAPTQLQGALDGGVFCGMSYAFLPEPRLFWSRDGNFGVYDQLSLNGVATGPVVKFGPTGTVDEHFSSAELVGVATLPKFMSFHIYEILGRAYYSHTRDITCHEPDNYSSLESPDPYELGGVNFATLDLRSLTGHLIQRVFVRSSLGIVNENFLAYHQVFVDEAVGLVAWSGINANQRSGGLVKYVGSGETVGIPEAWKIFDVDHINTFPGLLCFDTGLELNEAANWAGYNQAGLTASLSTSMVPYRIQRGCFRGSLVASAPVDGDPIGNPNEGIWTCVEPGTHKGCLHFCFDQAFVGGGYFTGAPGSSFVFGGYPGSGRLRVYSPYRAGSPRQFDAVWHFELDDETVVTSETHHEGGTSFPPDAPDGDYVMRVIDPVQGCTWAVTAPEFLPVTGPTHLWHLRNLAAIDPADTAQHGFNPFFGAVTDNDGCHNCLVLKAMHDPIHRQSTLLTPTSLGVFLTGMLEKFKGVTRFTVSGQLAKITHNGNWDGAFEGPEFGPPSFILKQNISSGADETHYNKIACGTISPGGKAIYVGGKFTQLVAGTSVRDVGHICSLDIETGGLLS